MENTATFCRVRTSIPETPCRMENAGTRVVQRGGEPDGGVVAGGGGGDVVIGGDADRAVGRQADGGASYLAGLLYRVAPVLGQIEVIGPV